MLDQRPTNATTDHENPVVRKSGKGGNLSDRTVLVKEEPRKPNGGDPLRNTWDSMDRYPEITKKLAND